MVTYVEDDAPIRVKPGSEAQRTELIVEREIRHVDVTEAANAHLHGPRDRTCASQQHVTSVHVTRRRVVGAVQTTHEH